MILIALTASFAVGIYAVLKEQPIQPEFFLVTLVSITAGLVGDRILVAHYKEQGKGSKDH